MSQGENKQMDMQGVAAHKAGGQVKPTIEIAHALHFTYYPSLLIRFVSNHAVLLLLLLAGMMLRLGSTRIPTTAAKQCMLLLLHVPAASRLLLLPLEAAIATYVFGTTEQQQAKL